MIFEGTNIALGTWLIISDLSIFSSVWLKMNNMLIGVFLAIIGAALMNKKNWMGWLTIIIGYWLVLSIFISNIEDCKIYLWSNLIIGVLLIIEGIIIHAPKPIKLNDLYTHLKRRDNRVL